MDKKQIETLKNTGLNVAGVAGGHIALKKIPLPEKVNKFKGIAVAAGGVLLQFQKNEILKELGKGVAMAGALDAIDEFTPEAIKAKAGEFIPKLSGYPGGLGMPVEFSEEEDLEMAIDELELGDEFGNVAIEQNSQFG